MVARLEAQCIVFATEGLLLTHESNPTAELGFKPIRLRSIFDLSFAPSILIQLEKFMIQTLAMFSGILMPFFNIPLIIRIVRRRSSQVIAILPFHFGSKRFLKFRGAVAGGISLVLNPRLL